MKLAILHLGIASAVCVSAFGLEVADRDRTERAFRLSRPPSALSWPGLRLSVPKSRFSSLKTTIPAVKMRFMLGKGRFMPPDAPDTPSPSRIRPPAPPFPRKIC